MRLHLLEWGDPAAPPLVLCHGMWDHARSFAVFAPLLAERFRVVAVDARGHGDSEWADAYTWATDVHDIVNVVRSFGRRVHLLGHSKGGGQVTDAACAVPDLIDKLVNIDGFGPPSADGFGPPTQPGRGKPPAEQFALYLDVRRAARRRNRWRHYAALDDLAERRRAQNPRLSVEWLRYFAFYGARREEGGWVWKSDPHMASGFSPWTPDWIGPSYRRLRAPMLAIVGSEPDTWGPLPEEILAERLSHVPHLFRRTVPGAGHFVHIEKPVETAGLVLDYLES